ncbi:tetratricopeptide repeat protein [Massilia sp. YIM B04103]|uniref:tetratricopeptide repeat protein n=1 Tax=Massilia sp. YIM B04103 TaxID=2963106 RepID=UPI00210C5300|nr:tetratricopeptide repeat protein [Massilia sp. YIM B04103]
MKGRIAALLLAASAGLAHATAPTAPGAASGIAALNEARELLRGPAASPAGWPRAFSLLKIAAEDGNAAAAYYLGLMYRNGMGVARDSNLAAHWLCKAAQGRVAPAMFLYANMLLNGEGAARDEVTARRWIEQAAALEHPGAMLQMALALREGSMGFERDEAQYEIYMKEAAHALRHQMPEP